MAETVFHKDGQLAYAYSPAQEVNLRADGWADGPPPVEPEVTEPPAEAVAEAAPAVPDLPPPPVDPAPPAQEAP